MASGTGERPLPGVPEEKGLLGIGGISASAMFNLSANATYYLVFPTGIKTGLISFTGVGTVAVAKSGFYIFNSGSTSDLQMVTLLAISQSGTTVTPQGNNVIRLVNASGNMHIGVIMFEGNAPTVTTTPP